jgi:hypothetical protein
LEVINNWVDNLIKTQGLANINENH